MKKIATASTPSALSLSASGLSAPTSSAVTISPLAPIRSLTSKRSGRGINGSSRR
jgi:hypothetical protein